MDLTARPITVTVVQGRPRRFYWRRRWYGITHIDEIWQDAGAWWADEAPHWFWRVASGSAWFELVSDLARRQWWLYRIYD
jgi:hypothetical protein